MSVEKTQSLLKDLALQATRTRKRRTRLKAAIAEIGRHGDWRAVAALFGFLDEAGIGPAAAEAIRDCLQTLAPEDWPEFDRSLKEALSDWEEERLNRWPVRALDLESAPPAEGDEDAGTTVALLVATACHPNDMHRERAILALDLAGVNALALGVLLVRLGDPIEEIREAAQAVISHALKADLREAFASHLPLLTQLAASDPAHHGASLQTIREFLDS